MDDLVPADVRARFAPDNIVLVLYGLHDGDPCPCGRPFRLSDYPTQVCLGCRRPWPRLCAYERGCSTFVYPLEDGDGGWLTPEPMCADHTRGARKQARVTSLRDSGIPADVLELSGKEYRKLDHRKPWDDAVAQWRAVLRGQMRGPTALYLHGHVGSGKTTALGYAASRAILDGSVGSVMWIEHEEDLVTAAKRWDDSCFELIERARRVDLLVVDELFSRGLAPYTTEQARDRLGAMFSRRWGARPKATLFASNGPQRFSCADLKEQAFDRRVASRWDVVGRVVEIGGVDMRLSAARSQG